MILRAVIYARYSGDKQREASIDDQNRNCTIHSARESFSLGRAYQDKAISGATKARPGYLRMLEDAAAGAFDILLVDDLSRLSRDDYEMKGVLRKLAWLGIRVIGVTDGYDSARKGHKIHAGFKGLMNEMFLDDLRDRTHRGMSGQALKGFNCGGRTYGYRNIPIEDPERKDAYGRPAIIAVRYEIDAAQADVVQKVYAWYAQGRSYSWIAAELNRQHIESSRGGTWATSAIKVLLENEMYAGKLIWNRREWIKHPDTGRRTYKVRPREEWIETENQELRIVPQETINAIRQRQKKNKDAYSGMTITPLSQRYLFSGILVCAECGGNFTVTGQHRYGCASAKNRGAEVCGNRLTVSKYIVEERLLAGIKEQLLTPAAIEKFKRAAVDAIEEHKTNDQTELLRRQLKDALRERDNLLSAIKAGIVTTSTKTALECAETTIEDMERRIKQNSHANLSGILPRAVERYQQAIEGLGREFDGHIAQAREVIKSLVGEKIRIHRRGDHLEAELQNNMTAMLVRMMGNHSDLVGCGGRI